MPEDDTDEMNDAEAGDSWQVYFLSLADPANPGRDFGLVKVGITKKDVERRIEQLQTGNPYQIRCAASFPSPVARQVENWVHRAYASRVAQLEWLRLGRSEIPDLVKAAQQEGERLARIAEASVRWGRQESNGKERQPGAEERDLHAEVRHVLADLWPVTFRLEHTKSRIALKAGRVLRIPGIVRMWRFSPSRRFNSKMAIDTFHELAAAHMVEGVGGKFYWRSVPNRGSPGWAELRAEVERVKEEQRKLDAAMLDDSNWLREEGERTSDLAHLHEEYLVLKQREARLKVDEKDLRAKAIQAIEDHEAIAGVCSFGRSRKQDLNDESFCEAHPDEAAQCSPERREHIRRHIYASRSY